MPFDEAVLEGAAGIAVPTLISTLAICCVFVSVFFLQGAARYLFTPLAHGRGLRHARLLCHLAHADARSSSACCCAASRSGMAPVRPAALGRFHDGVQSRLRPVARLLWLAARRASCAGASPLPAVAAAPSSPARPCCRFRSAPTSSPRWMPGLIQLHVRAPARTAHRADRADLRRRSRTISARSPRARIWSSSWTISACRSAPTILPSPTAATIGVNDGQILI